MASTSRYGTIYTTTTEDSTAFAISGVTVQEGDRAVTPLKVHWRYSNGAWTVEGVGKYDPGSFTISSGQYYIQHDHLTLTGSEVLTATGTAEVIVFDQQPKSGILQITGAGAQ